MHKYIRILLVVTSCVQIRQKKKEKIMQECNREGNDLPSNEATWVASKKGGGATPHLDRMRIKEGGEMTVGISTHKTNNNEPNERCEPRRMQMSLQPTNLAS